MKRYLVFGVDPYNSYAGLVDGFNDDYDDIAIARLRAFELLKSDNFSYVEVFDSSIRKNIHRFEKIYLDKEFVFVDSLSVEGNLLMKRSSLISKTNNMLGCERNIMYNETVRGAENVDDLLSRFYKYFESNLYGIERFVIESYCYLSKKPISGKWVRANLSGKIYESPYFCCTIPAHGRKNPPLLSWFVKSLEKRPIVYENYLIKVFYEKDTLAGITFKRIKK